MNDNKISNNKWESEREKIKVNKKLINKMIIKHLIYEANEEAVLSFEKESGIIHDYDKDLLHLRSEIKKNIYSGKIDNVIDLINEIDTDILRNERIEFELLKLKFIEYLKQNKSEEALEFAKNKLYALAENNDDNNSELKKLMLLFMYDDINKSPFINFLNNDYFKSVFSIVNNEILKFKMENFVPTLHITLKIMKFYQQELKSCGINFSEITDVTPIKYK